MSSLTIACQTLALQSLMLRGQNKAFNVLAIFYPLFSSSPHFSLLFIHFYLFSSPPNEPSILWSIFPPTHSSSAAPLLQEAEGHCRGVGMDGTACFGDSPQIPLVIPVTATAMQRPSRLYTRSFAHFIHSLPLSLSLALSLLSSHFLFVSFEVVLETFLVPCKWTGVLKQKNLNHS